MKTGRNDPCVCGSGMQNPIGSMPSHLQVSRVVLHYDNHARLTDLKVGDCLELTFRADGTFVEAMKNGE